MASGDIKVQVSDMSHIGKELKNKSENFKSELSKLIKDMEYVLDKSEGEFKSKATPINNSIEKNMNLVIEKLKEIGEWCVEAADAFEQADRKAAKKANL
jgi:uncharacterized protein YukE